MIVRLICVGKTEKEYFKTAEKEYIKRLTHYFPFEKIEIPELKNVKKLSKKDIKKKEGELILKHCSTHDQLILLDEKGKEFNSVGFSEYLQKKMNQGGKTITFVVGGAYGFSDDVYNHSSGKISLSKMTFSHQMVRTFFIEQLYRAATILRGEPYHHQ